MIPILNTNIAQIALNKITNWHFLLDTRSIAP